MKTLVTDRNYRYELTSQAEMPRLCEAPQIELLDIAKERLLEIAVSPGNHKLLSALDRSEARLIADQIKNSLQYARGILDYHDRQTKPGENHGGMLICRGACGAANDRLNKCVEKIRSRGFESPFLEVLQNYLNEANNYLESFGGTNPFFPELGTTHINGTHHNQLYLLARYALEFAAE